MNGHTTHLAAKLSVRRLMRGDLRGAFLLGTILLGFAVPAVFISYGLLLGNASQYLILTIGAAVVTGNWFSKYAVIKAGIFAPFF